MVGEGDGNIYPGRPSCEDRDSRRDTGDLLERILDESSRIEDIAGMDGYDGDLTLPRYLAQLLAERRLRKSDVIRGSGLNETFAYQIFSGDRHPSRNKTLQLIFALQSSPHEASRILHLSGNASLYCRNRRDAIILYCLAHGYNLFETDTTLYRFREQTITDEHSPDNPPGTNTRI